jgi:hypothetical protein
MSSTGGRSQTTGGTGGGGGINGTGGRNTGGTVVSSGGYTGGGTASGGSSFSTGGTLPDGAAPGSTKGSVACGATPCALGPPNDYSCCLTVTAFCAPAVGCLVIPGIPMSCDDAADCPPGSVCCYTLSTSGIGSTCAPSCDAQSDQLCRTDGECPLGTTCKTHAQNPDYESCQP